MGVSKKASKFRGQEGMTLIEIVISSGLVGIIMIVIMALLGQVGDIATVFQGQASTMEAVAESVAVLNSTIPLATRIQSCACRATPGTRANCIWEPSQPWYDPSIDGGISSPVTLLEGEFESHSGPTSALTDVLNLSTFGGKTCEDHNSTLDSGLWRGCKQTFKLIYYRPTVFVAGATPNAGTHSNAGMIELQRGGTSNPIRIGKNDPMGAGGIGVTNVSCGFDNSSGGTTGATAVFVLNFKIKSKSNTIAAKNHRNYESWYPSNNEANLAPLGSSANFHRGQFREVHLKFPLRNVSTRGVYSWRAESVRSCKVNGQAASNTAECCSQALTGGACVACLRSGQAGSASSCCSGTVSGGICQ